MYIEFLVEEPSAEAALLNIIPRIISADIKFTVHPYQGKQDLLRKLPQRLSGYASWLPSDYFIVVLVDADDDDCRTLKANLESVAGFNGLMTKSATAVGSPFQVLNRLAIEELEAWFFGDIQALCAAYPSVHNTIGAKARYRYTDSIAGGTWEALERELQRAGYFRGGLAKITAAREISQYMDPARNRSHSFQLFRQGLLDLISQ